MRRNVVTSNPARGPTRTLAAAAALAAVLLAGCAALSGTPRVGAVEDGRGEMMNLDTAAGQTSIRCPAHRQNGGGHVGYSSYAVAGSAPQIRAAVCPPAPLPDDNRWVYTERTRPDQPDAVEIWASIDADIRARPQWQRAAPTLSFMCALAANSERNLHVRLDWAIPAHQFAGVYAGEYSLAWDTTGSQSAAWEASTIEAEAIWMIEPAAATMLRTLTAAPASGSAHDATVTFNVVDSAGAQHEAVFDLNGWEHALTPLTADCPDAVLERHIMSRTSRKQRQHDKQAAQTQDNYRQAVTRNLGVC